MSDGRHPIGDHHVPDKVLAELSAAFAVDEQRESELSPLTQDITLADDALPAAQEASADSPDPPAPSPTDHDPAKSRPANSGPAESEPGQSEPGQSEPKVPGPDQESPKRIRRLIKIGDSDLVDPVYFDEEGEGRLRGTSLRATEASVAESRIPILIGGDEIEGESGGIPIGTGPASMDPRVRARRIAVRRAIGRRRLQWIFIGGGVLVVAVGVLALLGSSLFAISRVDVSGAQRIDQSRLDRVIDELRGTPALLVNTGDVERELEADPWVQAARVSTRFPHDATIELVERVPIATYAADDGQFRIVDVEGKVVGIERNRPVEFMLINTGGGAAVDPGAFAGQRVTYAAQLVEALSASMRTRTSAVVVSDNDELTLVFHTGARVVLGGPTELLEKLIRLEAVLAQPDADSYTLINVSTSEISTK